MNKINVRCCCIPTKILGTTILPQVILKDGSPRITDYYINADRIKIKQMHKEEFSAEYPEHSYHCIEASVYSDDRPIEFWRGIEHFKEGERTSANRHYRKINLKTDEWTEIEEKDLPADILTRWEIYDE